MACAFNFLFVSLTALLVYNWICKNKFYCVGSKKNNVLIPTKKIIDEWKTKLMSLATVFHLLCAQHVSDINISIFRSLRLCWWITTSVVLYSVCCVFELLLRLVFGGVRFAGWSTASTCKTNTTNVLQSAKRTPPNTSRNKSSNTQRTEKRKPMW